MEELAEPLTNSRATERPVIWLARQLGAQGAGLRAMVVRQGVLLAAVGLALGLVAAAVLMRVLSSLLFEVDPVDPATYCAVSAGLLAAAAAASYIPAHRASIVNPIEALRAE